MKTQEKAQENMDWKKATSPWTDPFQRSQDASAMSASAPAASATRQAGTQTQHQQDAEAVVPTRDALSAIFNGN